MPGSQQDWKIRIARDTDIEALLAMRLKLDEHLARSNPRQLTLSPHGRDAVAGRYRLAIDDPSARVVLAVGCVEDGPIGMAFGRATINEELNVSGLGRIDDVWVDPVWRRRGICREMIMHLFRFFESNSVEAVDLFYTVGNQEGERTWKGLGFEPVLTVASARLTKPAVD